MLLEAVYHRSKQNWAYAYDTKTIHLRIRTKRGDDVKVSAVVGDKYIWDKTRRIVPMDIKYSDALYDYWEVEVEPPYRRLRYGFQLEGDGRTVYLTEEGFRDTLHEWGQGFFEYPFLNPADVIKPPAWAKDAVFYQIFPERFANGDPSNDPEGTEPWGGKPMRGNFFGGDLQGVIDHLDHLEELGINAIYFTPLFEATTNHKYDTTDYMKVDPHFGTNEKLKELVDACHARGIRVLLDAVFNHSGGQFAPFLDVKKNGKNSRFADWFHVREWPAEVKDGIPTYDAFAFEPHMPKLNTENPEMREYLLKVARYWIEEIGVDGWRLDVANEVDHRFWRMFRDVVKEANPDAYILGEIWHDSWAWLQGDQFDAVMNYPFTYAVLDFFSTGKLDGAGLSNLVGSIFAGTPRQLTEVAFNLLDSHDTARLLTLCGGNKAKMKQAAVFQLTSPGAPCIYYGDEIGMDGDNDPGCRKCMEWDESKQDRDLFVFYKEMIALRKAHSALRAGNFRFLYAKEKDRCVAFERFNDDEHFVIAMNASTRSRKLTVKTPAGGWVDALTGDTYTSAKGKLAVELPAYGYKILRRTEA